MIPSRLKKIVLFLFALLFFLSSAQVISILYNSRTQENAFDELERTLAAGNTSLPDRMQEADAEDGRPILPQFKEIYTQNPDFYGWLSIEETNLSYPVMATPEDPEYYLRRAFDQTYAVSGVPFLDGDCTENSGNYLIYGHNMKNGTMFAPLLSYAEEAFWREHPTLRFDTLYETGTYAVIAAFYTEIAASSSQNEFRYYQYTDLNQAGVFDEYLQQVYAAALYDTGVVAQYPDSLLTLSTCSDHTKNGRFVVVAVKTTESGKE